jgi:16S rRNA (guanine966-N2)-methyltransferase
VPRVIAGTAGGRRLRTPPGGATRPTSDRVKEALFSALGDLAGVVVLDLFAGSGALAVEALSRGAARAVLVEADRRAEAVARANLDLAGVADRALVVGGSAEAFCRRPAGGPFDLVLLDPPYRTGVDVVESLLAALAGAGALVPGGRIVLERDRRATEPPPAGPHHERDRTYGDTVLRHLRVPDEWPAP